MSKRLNLLGAVGFNEGYKPAVQLVIPPVREEQQEAPVPPAVGAPDVAMECQSLFKCVRACGWPAFLASPAIYAAYSIRHEGSMTVETFADTGTCEIPVTVSTTIGAEITYSSSRVSPCSVPDGACQECEAASGGITVVSTTGEDPPEEDEYDAACGEFGWLTPPESIFPFGLEEGGPQTLLECFSGDSAWTLDYTNVDEISYTRQNSHSIPGVDGFCDYDCEYTQRATITLSDSVNFLEIANTLSIYGITWNNPENGGGCQAEFCIAPDALSGYVIHVIYRWTRADASTSVFITWDENTYYVPECQLVGGETPSATASFSETLGVGVFAGITRDMLADPFDGSHLIKVENVVFT